MYGVWSSGVVHFLASSPVDEHEDEVEEETLF